MFHDGLRCSRLQPQDVGRRHGLVDELRDEAAIAPAHDARTDGRGENVRDGLADVRRVVDAAAGADVHHAAPPIGPPLLPPPVCTPPCGW